MLQRVGSYSCFPRFDPWPLDMPTTATHETANDNINAYHACHQSSLQRYLAANRAPVAFSCHFYACVPDTLRAQ